MQIKPLRQLVTQPHRNAWLEINLAALEQNVRWWRKNTPAHQALMAVVKADAYGHGALIVTPILKACGVSYLGVSNVDEALQLRQGGVEIPILVLGATPEWAWDLASSHDVQLTVFSQRDIDCLAQVKHSTVVHLKVDTGMHRLGAPPELALDLLQQLQAMPHVIVKGLFTHLAKGEDEAVTLEQWQAFETGVLQHLDELPPLVHFANTPATLALRQSSNPLAKHLIDTCNLLRLGIGLWGYETTEPDLLPVMGLKARISHLQTLEAGEGVSYGHSFHTVQNDSVIATIPLGYADGIPRCLSNQLKGRYMGHLIPQVGNITMDQMMFDVTDVVKSGVLKRPPKVGDVMTLLEHGKAGQLERDAITEGLSLNHWAVMGETIAYELMCGLRVSLPRSVVR